MLKRLLNNKKIKAIRSYDYSRFIGRLDRYIIGKFIGTYFFSILLIISISIVIDFNENLNKFEQYHTPWKAIVFDYYANFIPYFANLFSPLFVFIAVIFFTSKMAGNSEVISIMASGISFKRMLKPYMISCVFISVLNYGLSAYVIPHGTVIRQNFEALYKNSRKNTSAENVQLQVDKGVIAYMQHYDNIMKRGYGFCLDKFENKKLVSHLTATEIQYDTISDSKYHWKLSNWKIRNMRGVRETITSGMKLDTLIFMEPTDLVYSKVQQETFTSPQLADYIDKQITIIGASLSSRKRKGGMGMYLGLGLVLSFVYIMLQTVSSTFAINAGAPPMLAAWTPNIIFAFVAYFCYKKAPN